MTQTEDGRAARTRRTRQQLFDAIAELVAERGVDELTYAEIAERAGVGERTVYRHFPSRDVLLEEFDRYAVQRMQLPDWPSNASDLPGFAMHVFAGFDTQPAVIEAVLASEARRWELPGRRDRVRRLSDAADLQRLDDPDAAAVGAVVGLLVSAAAWQRMRRLHELDGITAGRAVAFCLEAIDAHIASGARLPAAPEADAPAADPATHEADAATAPAADRPTHGVDAATTLADRDAIANHDSTKTGRRP